MTYEISPENYEKLALAAKGANVSVDEMLKRILDVWLHDGGVVEQRPGGGDQVVVYAIYKRTRVEALFDCKTGAIRGTTAPIDGKNFGSASGAARAVVESLNPGVNSNRSGPRFWRVATTGKELSTIL